jgi:hypothetical protein
MVVLAPMTERRQLTDDHANFWRAGCVLLAQMTKREWRDGESQRYRRFRQIDYQLTWKLVGPHSCSLFSAALEGPPPKGPEYSETIDWPVARAWRRALIEATGLTPIKK